MLNDIHPEYVNDIVITHPTNGKTYKRVPDIFDCWFESGSMPFAQNHYPFTISKEVYFNSISCGFKDNIALIDAVKFEVTFSP